MINSLFCILGLLAQFNQCCLAYLDFSSAYIHVGEIFLQLLIYFQNLMHGSKYLFLNELNDCVINWFRYRFGSAYFIYDIFSMYKVYNAKLYDKLNMKALKWSTPETFYSMIPSTASGELTYFISPAAIGDQKLPSFWEYIKITKLMVFHHMFIGSYGLIVISSWRGGLGDCIFSFMFMMEFSTPFVSFRAILGILKMKKSKLYLINGLLMVITFAIFRIFMLPFLLYHYSTVVNLSFIEAILKLPLGCQLSIIALFLPQFYWFNLMIQAALRVSSSTMLVLFVFLTLIFFQMFKTQNEKKEINHNLKNE